MSMCSVDILFQTKVKQIIKQSSFVTSACCFMFHETIIRWHSLYLFAICFTVPNHIRMLKRNLTGRPPRHLGLQISWLAYSHWTLLSWRYHASHLSPVAVLLSLASCRHPSRVGSQTLLALKQGRELYLQWELFLPLLGWDGKFRNGNCSRAFKAANHLSRCYSWCSWRTRGGKEHDVNVRQPEAAVHGHDAPACWCQKRASHLRTNLARWPFC